MLKKITVFLLLLSLLTVTGCKDKSEQLGVESGDEYISSETEEQVQPQTYKNPLTGLSDISGEKEGDRPVAIMINNINIAQPVQTGLDKADIVYETEVEGGITRLMAVYQDVENAGRIGTVRSARYPYVDLAMGHNAIYIHCGEDPTYCAPHLKDLDDVSLSTENYGKRVSNGLASEHTLYVEGEKLWNGLVKDKWKTENKDFTSWQNFSDENTPVMLAEGTTTSVTIPFSTSYKTTFDYDEASGKYIRLFNGKKLKDYITGDNITTKNVFVLTTTIKDYPDGKHRQVYLTGGDGYYFVNGTYTAIKWSKGKAGNSFSFTNADGTPLTVNAGNSWVCIANMSTSQPIFE